MSDEPMGVGVLSMMTPEQRERATQPMAMQQVKILTHPMGEHPFRSTGHFHMVVDIPTPDAPICPSVSSREQRLLFILEGFLELVAACGFRLVPTIHAEGDVTFGVDHIEGSRYDVVEVADALSDLNVVTNGTGVEWGLPLHVTDHEVYCSNLTKLDSNGQPILNGITEGYRVSDGSQVDHPKAAIWCDIRDPDEPGYRPDLPIGKILKPDGFVKANIPAALLAFERKEF